MVFVHGLFGNCRRTWGRMPQWVLEAAGLDLDVVSFSYPSRPWERAAIPQTADDLKTWLDTELQVLPPPRVRHARQRGPRGQGPIAGGRPRRPRRGTEIGSRRPALSMASDPPYHQHRRAASGRGALRGTHGSVRGARGPAITGVAGVGKSAVTRTLAWRLGCYYLAQPGGAPPSRCTSPSSRSPCHGRNRPPGDSGMRFGPGGRSGPPTSTRRAARTISAGWRASSAPGPLP